MDANTFSKSVTAVVNEGAKAGIPIQWMCATLDELKFRLQFQTYVAEQQANAKKFAENMANGSKIIKPR